MEQPSTGEPTSTGGRTLDATRGAESGPPKRTALPLGHLRMDMRMYAAAAERELFRIEATDEPNDEPGSTTTQTPRLGRFVLERRLGEGGMGTVYRAHDAELSRDVAIKIALVDLGGERRPDRERRLLREATALAQLSHPNVVQVHEVGTVAGQVFVVMELVPGRDLRKWLREDRRSPARVLDVFVQAARGLAAAHEAGLVHRDFKPANVVVGGDGRVRVVDFGLAVDDADAPSSVSGSDLEGSTPSTGRPRLESTTTSPTLSGTPPYMAPEQHRGARVDARSDQFSFCVALFESLYGARPFSSQDLAALLDDKMAGRIRIPDAGRVPSHVRRALLRGLRASPEDRFPSMGELADALADDPTARWRRRGAMLAVCALMGLSAWGGLQESPDERCSGAADQLAEIWNDARRAEVGASITETGLSYAPMTREHVVAALDDYSRRWIAAQTDTCEASVVRAEQTSNEMSQRMSCLRARRVALRSTVETLAAIERKGLVRARGLVDGLPRIDACEDLGALVSTMPSPEDPELFEASEELGRRLAEIQVDIRAAKVGAALTALDELVADAEELGFGPRLAEILERRGTVLEWSGRFSDSEEDLVRAYSLATEHAHLDVAARAAVKLITIVGVRQSRHAAGMQWATTALPLTRRQGGFRSFEADGLNALGTLEMAMGKTEDALLDHRAALDIMESIFGPDDVSITPSLEKIGSSLNRLGRYEEALEYLRRGLTIRERDLGRTHLATSSLLLSLSSVLRKVQEYEEAHEMLERALEIGEESLPPNHPFIGAIHDSMGGLRDAQGRYDEALEHFEESLRIARQTAGPRSENAAISLRNTGLALSHRGDTRLALEKAQEALSIFEELLDSEHPSVVTSELMTIDLRTRLGEVEDARALAADAERGLRILEEGGAVDTKEVGDARFVLAKVLWLLPQERARALELTRRAREEIALGGPSPLLETVEGWLEQHDREDHEPGR